MSTATTIADSLGDTIDVETPEIDAEIDIRDDAVSLFESPSGRLFVDAPACTLEVVPSVDGVLTDPVTALPDGVTELEPASAREVQTDATSVESVERYD